VLLLTAATAASTILVLDAIGLVVFTIAGREVALQMSRPLLIIAGVGGVLRDILCNDVPVGDSLSLGDAEVRLRRGLELNGPARPRWSCCGASEAAQLSVEAAPIPGITLRGQASQRH
jgi:hypothetical protein